MAAASGVGSGESELRQIIESFDNIPAGTADYQTKLSGILSKIFDLGIKIPDREKGRALRMLADEVADETGFINKAPVSKETYNQVRSRVEALYKESFGVKIIEEVSTVEEAAKLEDLSGIKDVYEVTILQNEIDEKTKESRFVEVQAKVILDDTRGGVYINRGDRMSVAEYRKKLAQNPALKNQPHTIDLIYHLKVGDKAIGGMSLTIDTLRDTWGGSLYDASGNLLPESERGEPKKYVYINTADNRDKGQYKHVGDGLYEVAGQLSSAQGFEGALRVQAEYNSPGFHWMTGFNQDHNDNYLPENYKALFESVGKKISTLADAELEKDEEFIKVKHILAEKELRSKGKLGSWNKREDDEKIEKRVGEMNIQYVRQKWPEVLRRRDIWDSTATQDDCLLDELAYAQLGLPRLLDRDPFKPHTNRFKGHMSLPAVGTAEGWKKLKKERREQIKVRVREIEEREKSRPY